ncbi:thiamine pyrophosphate-binding protein [Vallitalea okinawensis]|uniref:thiamine pyrophosphate-binding protein n=1 Tax=Vallitalea okinawensis TaxID=2078660 RepID=UPI000CFCA56F|nr:thiamine pyrophosphate-binding protein [Vallitalea okinawensis]
MRIADAIAKYLELNNVKHVFGIGAGTVGALYDAIHDTEIEVIVTRNEAGSTYSASRYSSMSKKISACILAGGVGINNGINGVADAHRVKAPVLIISGFVNRWQMGKGAVQELNTENILAPITKYSKTVLEEKDVLPELKRAIECALTPPYGPVHISIPIDVQIAEYTDTLPDIVKIDPANVYDSHSLKEAVSMINKVPSGLIMIGKGARGLGEEVKSLSSRLGWPIISTPEGKSVVEGTFPYHLGNYGFCSSDAAVHFVEKSDYDLVLILGTSLGESATRNFNEVLVKGKQVIHIDYDNKELGKVFDCELLVHQDLNNALPYILENTEKKSGEFNPPEKINEPYVKNHTGISVRLLMEKLPDLMPKNTTFLSDIGEYMNFVFKYLHIKEGMDYETSLNYGAMGNCVAGVMGAYLTDEQRKYAVIVGDGSFFMNGTEILTARQYNMPIVYFVLNNAMYGYVEHGQRFIYKRPPQGHSYERFSICDMAKAMDIKAFQITELSQLDAYKEDFASLEGPILVELITDGSEKVPAADRFKSLSNEK